MALVSVPPHKFVCSPWWYYRLQEADECDLRILPNGTTSIPNFIRIRPPVLELNHADGHDQLRCDWMHIKRRTSTTLRPTAVVSPGAMLGSWQPFGDPKISTFRAKCAFIGCNNALVTMVLLLLQIHKSLWLARSSDGLRGGQLVSTWDPDASISKRQMAENFRAKNCVRPI